MFHKKKIAVLMVSILLASQSFGKSKIKNPLYLQLKKELWSTGVEAKTHKKLRSQINFNFPEELIIAIEKDKNKKS